MRLCAARWAQQIIVVLATRRDPTDNMPCHRPEALQAGQDQAHQNKHFALIRLPEAFWQNWVFHISDSKRRRTRSLL
jgi:hypothetical protein